MATHQTETDPNKWQGPGHEGETEAEWKQRVGKHSAQGKQAPRRDGETEAQYRARTGGSEAAQGSKPRWQEPGYEGETEDDWKARVAAWNAGQGNAAAPRKPTGTETVHGLATRLRALNVEIDRTADAGLSGDQVEYVQAELEACASAAEAVNLSPTATPAALPDVTGKMPGPLDPAKVRETSDESRRRLQDEAQDRKQHHGETPEQRKARQDAEAERLRHRG